MVCLIGITVLSAGCTDQPGDGVTPIPTTILSTSPAPTGTTMQIPPTMVTTGIPSTVQMPGTAPSGETVTTTTDQGGPEERVNIMAKNFAFDRSTITVPAGSRVIVEFQNEDRVGHNVAFYTSPSLSTPIYRGEIISGPRTITYTFTAPATPGTYYFHCDPHPDMDGQFIVT